MEVSSFAFDAEPAVGESPATSEQSRVKTQAQATDEHDDAPAETPEEPGYGHGV